MWVQSDSLCVTSSLQTWRTWRTSTWWRAFRSRWTRRCSITSCVTTLSRQINLASCCCGCLRSAPSACRPRSIFTTSTWTATCPATTYSSRCCTRNAPERSFSESTQCTHCSQTTLFQSSTISSHSIGNPPPPPKHALRCLHTSVLCLCCAARFASIPWFGPKQRKTAEGDDKLLKMSFWRMGKILSPQSNPTEQWCNDFWSLGTVTIKSPVLREAKLQIQSFLLTETESRRGWGVDGTLHFLSKTRTCHFSWQAVRRLRSWQSSSYWVKSAVWIKRSHPRRHFTRNVHMTSSQIAGLSSFHSRG